MYLRESLEEVRAQKDKLENPVTPLCPLIKTQYIYEEGKDGYSDVSIKDVPYSATKMAKLKNSFGHIPRESERVCVESVPDGEEQILLTEKASALLGTWSIFHHWQLPSPVVPNSTSVDSFAPHWSCPFNPQKASKQTYLEALRQSRENVQS